MSRNCSSIRYIVGIIQDWVSLGNLVADILNIKENVWKLVCYFRNDFSFNSCSLVVYGHLRFLMGTGIG